MDNDACTLYDTAAGNQSLNKIEFDNNVFESKTRQGFFTAEEELEDRIQD